MSEFTPITTQAEFDEAVKPRIKREQETLENKYSQELEQLKTQITTLEADNTAYQATIEESKSWEQEKADYEKQISGYKTAQLKQSIAIKAGLPLDLADRLTGDDEEALKADAERFSGFIKPTTHKPPLASTETHFPKDDDADLREMLHKLNEKGE